MAPRKRARTSSTSGSPSSETTVTTIELSGGPALSSEVVALWRSGRFTDTTVEVEGRSFAAHKNVLAAHCGFFSRHYDNEHMRDVDHPKLLEHVTAAAFEPLLTFLYEGKCTFEESLLAPVLRAASYLNVEPLERAAVVALTDRLSPSNALTAWTWGEELKLPELAEAAKETALKGFDEVEKIEEATLAQVQALVADDRLQTKSEEAVFSAVARFAQAKQPAEADLLALLRNVRFTLMSVNFLLGTVRAWPMLQSAAGKDLLVEMLAPLVSGPAQQPRLLKATDDGQFTWIIEGFNKLKQPKLFSPVFHSGKYNWRILIYPNGNNVTQLSVYIDVADAATLPQGWSRQAHFTLTVHNRKDPSHSVIKDADHHFTTRASDWGFREMVPLSDLRDPRSGFVMEGKLMISAKVKVEPEVDS